MMISNFPPPFPLPPCFCMINYKISKMDQEHFQKKFIQNIKFYMHMIGIKAQSPNKQPFKKTSLIHIRDPVQKFSTHSQFALGRRCAAKMILRQRQTTFFQGQFTKFFSSSSSHSSKQSFVFVWVKPRVTCKKTADRFLFFLQVYRSRYILHT